MIQFEEWATEIKYQTLYLRSSQNKRENTHITSTEHTIGNINKSKYTGKILDGYSGGRGIGQVQRVDYIFIDSYW